MTHIADLVANIQLLDETNERGEELNANPNWQFMNPEYPAFLMIIGELANLVKVHLQTIFISAHIGYYAENLR